jgi:hypothetical protein
MPWAAGRLKTRKSGDFASLHSQKTKNQANKALCQAAFVLARSLHPSTCYILYNRARENTEYLPVRAATTCKPDRTIGKMFRDEAGFVVVAIGRRLPVVRNCSILAVRAGVSTILIVYSCRIGAFF